MRAGWTEKWRPRSMPPGKWWGATHESGYEVGEVDAGRYLIADPQQRGIMSEAGDYLGFTSPDDAMDHVEDLLKS
jgi:hypothetical protein